MYADLKKDRLAWFVLITACVAIFFTAFEVRDPIISLGSVDFTTTEIAASLFILAAAAWATVDRAAFLSYRVLDLAVLLFLLSNFLSVGAALDKAGAFKFSLRMTFAALVYLGFSRLPARSRPHLLFACVASVTLLIVTALGLLQNYVDSVRWGYWLSPWQEGIFTFGTFYNVRVSSTLPFPTSLAMYIELSLPLLIAAGLWLLSRGQSSVARRRLLAVGVVAAITGSVAVMVYTYTRSALVALPLSMVIAAGLGFYYGYGRRVVAYFLLAAMLTGGILGLTALYSNKMAARLGVAEQVRRYGAEYTLIDFPPNLKPGEQYQARVHIKNTSDLPFLTSGTSEIMVSYRWFEEQRQANQFSLSTRFPREIAPGDGIDIDFDFVVPEEPGRYLLAIDMNQRGLGWLSAAHVRPVVIGLEIGEQGSQEFPVAEEETHFIWFNEVVTTPSRRNLWKAALSMWRDHPVLGVGPDQYRVRYAEYLTGFRPDQRVRTNNMFLEAAANTGIIGLLALMYMLAMAVWIQWRLVRNRALDQGQRLVALALFTALMAFLAHGILDNFLWMTGIVFVFFAQLGLTSWMYHGQKNVD